MNGFCFQRLFPLTTRSICRGFKLQIEKDIILESQFENLNWNGFLKGKHIDDAYGITTEEINDQLQPIYFHCNLLIQDAVQSEIEDYMNQKNPNKPFF